MRGNHIIWGRADADIPDATDERQRAEIQKCKLTQTKDRKTWFDVELDGKKLGRVRTIFGAMEYWPAGAKTSRHAGSQWSPNDPPHALAILALLSLHEK